MSVEQPFLPGIPPPPPRVIVPPRNHEPYCDECFHALKSHRKGKGRCMSRNCRCRKAVAIVPWSWYFKQAERELEFLILESTSYPMIAAILVAFVLGFVACFLTVAVLG